MALKVTKKKRNVYRRNRLRKGTKVPKSMAPGISNRHYAEITETVELTDIDANTTYQECFQLNQFKRAFALAPNFKFYRAKKVLWKYEPVYNLFAEGGGETIPLAYMVMNRTQDNNDYSAGQLREQGAIPRKFTSAITMSYTPNWCTPGLIAQQKDFSGNVVNIVQQGLQKCYKYLSTPDLANNGNQMDPKIITNQLGVLGYSTARVVSPSVIYNGHFAHFEQEIEGTQRRLCRRTVTVVWEFRGPKTKFIELGEPAVKSVEV